MSNRGDSLVEGEVFRALNHPVRRHFLRALRDAGTPLSPTVFHRRAEIPLANVSYHVGVLSTLGVIELVERIPRRGAVESLYRSGGRNAMAVTELLTAAETFNSAQNGESPPPPAKG